MSVRWQVLGLLLFLLVACSGGGGESGGQTDLAAILNPTPPRPPSTTTSSGSSGGGSTGETGVTTSGGGSTSTSATGPTTGSGGSTTVGGATASTTSGGPTGGVGGPTGGVGGPTGGGGGPTGGGGGPTGGGGGGPTGGGGPAPLPSAATAPSRVLPERMWGANRFLAFSTDRRLLPEDTDDFADIYLRDILLCKLMRITRGQNGDSVTPSISEDGRWIVFASDASDLVAPDGNGFRDIFLWDRLTGKFRLVTAGANGASSEPTISGDGNFVSFTTAATNLVGSDTESGLDILLYDRVNGIFEHISTTVVGDAVGSSLNSDGQVVAFTGKLFGYWQIFGLDRVSGLQTVVSQSATNEAGNGDSFHPSLSDAMGLTFSSQANNLVPGDSDTIRDVFLISAGPAISRVLQNAQEPVIARTNLNLVATSGGQATLRQASGVVSALGSATAVTLSNSFVAMQDGLSLRATNPAKGERFEMNPLYQPLVGLTGPEFQDLNINTSEDPMILDFTGDGEEDLVALPNTTGGQQSLILGVGSSSGSFTKTDFNLNAFVTAYCQGQFENSGTEDLVVSLSTQTCDLSGAATVRRFLRFYSGDGGGSLAPGPEFDLPGGRWPLPGQLDAGADLDLLMFQAPDRIDSTVPRSGEVLFGNGDGTFTDSGNRVTLPVTGSRPILANFGGDDRVDIAVLDATDEELEIHLNSGAGTFATPLTLSLPGLTRFEELVAADLDGNGTTDLISTRGRVLINDGSGNFSQGTDYPSSGFPVVQNLDGAGGLDVYFGSSQGTFFAEGAGPPVNSTGGRMPLLFKDYSGDGLLDQLVQVERGVVLLAGLGGGQFGRALSPVSLKSLVEVGDFNNDLLADLADGNRIALRRPGKVFNATDGPTAAFVRGLAFEDLDNDGNLDQLHTSIDDYQVFLGDGDGGFTGLGAISTPDGFGAYPYLLDLNHDGNIDLINTGDRTTPRVLFFAGQGDGSFGAPATLVVQEGGLARPKDYDGDGLADLLLSFSTGSPATPMVAFYSATAPATYAGATLSAASGGGRSVCFDVNRDALPDLFSLPIAVFAFFVDGPCPQPTTFPPTPTQQKPLSFLSNQGGGSFTNGVFNDITPRFSLIIQAAPFDLNSDQNMDLMMLDAAGNLQPALGDGTGLTTQPRFQFHSGAGRVLLEDFEFDGTFEATAVGNGIVVYP